MIVDDDPDTTYFLNVSLEGYSFDVYDYTDPVKALLNFKPYFYDLSIIDSSMPELDGFELFERIRKLDSKIKVCLMSSFQVYYQALREEHPTIDVRCFIKKPLTLNDLVNRIRRELDIELKLVFP